MFISGSKNSPGRAATHSRFPRTQAGKLVNQPFHYSTTGKSTKALCIWLQGVLPCITVSRSGMEASWQLFVISSGDAGLLSENQQLLYQYKGNWYNWKHLETKGVTHCSTTLRTGETLSTGIPSFPPVWGQGVELGWMFAWVHTHYWASGFMQRPLKIPSSFPFQKKEYSINLPRKDVPVLHIWPIWAHLISAVAEGTENCQKRALIVVSSAALHISVHVKDHHRRLQHQLSAAQLTAGLRNPAQMAGKAKSLAFRFLLQSFKGQFADQRGLGKNEDTGYLKYNLSWNKPPWGSFPKAAPTSRCCSGNENKRGR